MSRFVAHIRIASAAMNASNQTSGTETIGRWYWRYLVTVHAATDFCRYHEASTRFVSRADVAIVTERQSRASDRGRLSITSDSSSQSSVASFACSGPNNFVTAAIKESSSRSARCFAVRKSSWRTICARSSEYSLSCGNQPKVNENASTPASRNWISNSRSTTDDGCLIS